MGESSLKMYTREYNIESTFKSLKGNGIIDSKLCHHLKPTDSHSPRFYAQPKLHKLILIFLYGQLFHKT